MLLLKNVFLPIVWSFIGFTLSYAISDIVCPLCGDNEHVVWATDKQKCFPFRNPCFLLAENCERHNFDLEILEEVSKEECQKLCPPICSLEFQPICAKYHGVERTFSSPCMLESHSCQSGEGYVIKHEGACEEETN